MSNDQTARRVFGITYETMIRRILATFDKATASDIEGGARWYPEAGELAASLTREGLTLEHTSAVIAALSPRTKWERNVAGAVALIESGPAAALAIVHLTENVGKAERALVEGYGVFGPKSPKTRAFALNIAGDREEVTVDVWAMRVARLDEKKLSLKGAYDVVADAYRAAARRRGVDPSTMQATTWIVAREGRAA